MTQGRLCRVVGHLPESFVRQARLRRRTRRRLVREAGQRSNEDGSCGEQWDRPDVSTDATPSDGPRRREEAAYRVHRQQLPHGTDSASSQFTPPDPTQLDRRVASSRAV